MHDAVIVKGPGTLVGMRWDRKRLACGALLVLASWAHASFPLNSQPPSIPTKEGVWKLKQSKEVADEAERRLLRIRKECAEPGANDWAGEYSYGDGLGLNVNLAWAVKEGFVITWHGCLGLYDINYGKVSQDGNSFRFEFTLPNGAQFGPGFPQKVVRVLWGHRHYLIPPDGFISFANDINSGVEPSGKFLRPPRLLKTVDVGLEPTGRPGIPVEFLPFLLPGVVEAKITKVEWTAQQSAEPDFVTRGTLVHLNVGCVQGIRTGMTFFVNHPEALMTLTAVVRSVEDDSCQVMLVQMAGHGFKMPKVGWKLSTRPSYRRLPGLAP